MPSRSEARTKEGNGKAGKLTRKKSGWLPYAGGKGNGKMRERERKRAVSVCKGQNFLLKNHFKSRYFPQTRMMIYMYIWVT